MMMKKNVFLKSIFLVMGIFIFNYTIYGQAFKRLGHEEKAMEISLRDLNGKQISLSDYKDKKTLAVIFFKHPSLRGSISLAHWQKLYDKYKDSNNLSVIAVYCPQTDKGIPSDEMNNLETMISENSITYPVLIDDGLKVFSQYGIITLPSSMVLDTQGIVKYILPGFPTFGAEKDIRVNLTKVLGLPEDKVVIKKYEPDLDAGRNYKLAMAVLARGNIDKAITYLSLAISKDPKYPAPYALLGKLYSESSKNDKAIENYQKALDLDSTDVDTLINYGFLCMEMGLKDDALLQFKNIIEIAPDKSAEAYYGMGTIYLKNEVYDSALVKVQEAIRLYAKQKNISVQELLHLAMSHINAAEISMKSENKKDAIEQYKEALKKYNEVITDLLKEEQKSVRAN